MAKDEPPSKPAQRGAPAKPGAAGDSLDFTESGPSKPPVRPRPRKRPPTDDRVKVSSARRLGVPFVIVVAIVFVVVLIVAERSSNEVVTPKPSAKAGAPSQPAFKPPQT